MSPAQKLVTTVQRQSSRRTSAAIRSPISYAEWCIRHDCAHAHCPCECEHPQPFIGDNGRLYCGRCWFVDKVMTLMIPCTPAICAGEVTEDA